MSLIAKLNKHRPERYPARVDASYVYFAFNGMTESGKTAEYDVNTKDDKDWLGTIAWFGRWRCYSFNPAPSTTFEKTCLREIAGFCEKLTKEHNAYRRTLRAGNKAA